MSKRNLNLLYFATGGLHQGIGGGGGLINMVDIFERLGVNIQLISYMPEARLKIKHEQKGSLLNTTIICVPKSLPKILKVFSIPLILMYGLRHARRSNVIFAHGPTIVSGFPAMILAKMFRKPLIVHHMDIDDAPGFIYDRVLKNSNFVFAISHYLEGEAKDKGCKNVIYVPISIDTDVFQKDISEGRKIRKKLEIGDNEVVIGYAGSFWHIEGVPILLKAFSNLVKRYENTRLIIVGGGGVAESDNISQLIDKLALKENVILISPQPYELIPGYLSACDIACSPKIDCEEHRAANPIKIYEYMSMGLPMVVSAVGETTNLIKNGVNGFLVKPGDENDLERTLEYVIQNLESAREVGKRAREEVVKNYSQRTAQEKIGEIFQREFVNSNQYTMRVISR
ncbi:glycosyltransferase family 4 protein [Chloroflexota bacterium]